MVGEGVVWKGVVGEGVGVVGDGVVGEGVVANILFCVPPVKTNNVSLYSQTKCCCPNAHHRKALQIYTYLIFLQV